MNARADWLTERYFEALKDAKVRGYLFEQQNYIGKDDSEECRWIYELIRWRKRILVQGCFLSYVRYVD